ASRTMGVQLPIQLDGGEATLELGIQGCRAGCRISSVTASRPPGSSTLPFVIDRIDFGGADALRLDWTPTTPDDDGRPGGLLQVEAAGVLLDLPTALTGSAPTVPIADVAIIAAADTPPALLRDLARAEGARVTPLSRVEDSTRLRTRAVQAGVYAVMALACLL